MKFKSKAYTFHCLHAGKKRKFYIYIQVFNMNCCLSWHLINSTVSFFNISVLAVNALIQKQTATVFPPKNMTDSIKNTL